jgi:hypothetical protein
MVEDSASSHWPLGVALLDLRPYIRRTLWAGGLLALGLAVSAALWLILGAAGDVSGSQGAKGVAFVALVGLTLDVLSLIVLLALAELTRPAADAQTAAQPFPDVAGKAAAPGGQGSSIA